MSAHPRIGVRLDPRLTSEVEAGPRLESLLDQCVDLESIGIDVVWIAERPTSENALIPSALIFCTGVALRTRTLRVATGLLPLPLYHPLRIAEDAASLDVLSDGRLEIGLGLGSDPEAMARFGVDGDDRAERFAEALELLQLAWSAEPLDYVGQHFQCQGLAVFPRPVQAGGPPLWVGAAAPSAQRKGAERGCGLVIRAGDSCSAYLDRWAELQRPETPRVALLLGAPEEPAPLPGALTESPGSVQVDLVLPLPAEASPEAWPAQLDRLRLEADRLRSETAG